MIEINKSTSFGNLFVGFQNNDDPASPPLVALFHLDPNSGVSRQRWWSLQNLTPVTAPAGFGHSVYVLMRKKKFHNAVLLST